MIVIVYTDNPLNITETTVSSSQTIDEYIYSIRNDYYSDLIPVTIQKDILYEDNEIIPIIWCIIIAHILYVYHHFDIDYG